MIQYNKWKNRAAPASWLDQALEPEQGDEDADDEFELEFELEGMSSTPATVTPFKNIRRIWVHTNTLTVVGSSAEAKRARAQLCKLAPTDVMIGVNSQNSAAHAHRRDGAFKIYSNAKLTPAFRAAISEIQGCGAAIHFMTWVTPRARYCEGLVDTMFELCTQTGARSLLLDAEGPWTNRKPERGGYADFVEEVFKPLIAGRPCCVGVTHIVTRGQGDWVYKAVHPLIAACDYQLPQAYTTTKPGKKQSQAISNWYEPSRTMVMGLSGMSGVSDTKMRKDLEETDKLGTIQEVYYWSFRSLRRSTKRSRVIEESAKRARATRSSLPPPPLCHIPWPLF